MRIKNDYIIINVNGKQVKLHNTILNTYLYWIMRNQIVNNEDDRANLSMGSAYIKFNNSLDFDKTSTLTENDFDLKVGCYDSNTQISSTQIIKNYFYKIDNSQYSLYDIQNQQYITNIDDYIGRNITAIGFGGKFYGNPLIYACVNTFNYNISIESTDTVFSIARQDTLSTDAIFYCPSKLVKGAIHLIDGQDIFKNYYATHQYIALLESIGVGVMAQKMDQETSVKPYAEHITQTTNQLQISDEFVIEHYSDGLFPASNVYPATDLYPARIISEPLYPSENIYPANDLYMLESPYQYMQLKYKIYKQSIITGDITDTGKYYLLSKLIGNKDKIKMNIEYEGS